MAREQFVNDAATTLNGAINATVTSVTVTDGSVFPAGGDFRILVNSEIMKVTARATNVLTVVRAQDGTTAASHSDTDDVKSILTRNALVQFADDATGTGYSRFGGASHRKPYRMLNFAGTTLSESDFGWQDQGTSSAAATPAGGMAVTLAETTGNWKLRTIAMPTPPFALTAHLVFGAGHALLTGSGSTQGIGFRDSSSGRFVINNATLGDECAFWRFTNTATFSAVTTNQSQIEWRTDEIWMKIVDDNTNIYSFVSPDGIRWFETGSEVRDAWLASADELIWGINPRGEADKYFVCNSWVEHVDDAPLGFDFEVQQVELLTDDGTTQDITPGIINMGAAMIFHAGGEGVAAGTASTHASISMSYLDTSVTQRCYGGYSKDGESTVDDSRVLKDSSRVAQYVEDTDTPTGRATPTISGSDLRLTWNTHITTGETQGSVVFIGGSRHQSDLIGYTPTQGVVDTAESFTGVGFAPDAFISFSTSQSSFSGFSLSNDNDLGIGFAVNGGGQASVGFRNADNVATSECAAYTSDAYYQTVFTNDTTAKSQEVTSWDADGIETTNRITGGWTIPLTFLMFKLGNAADAAVIDFTWPGSTGEQTFSFGFRPRFVIMASVLSTSLNTIQDLDGCLAVSVMTDTVQSCSAMIMADNLATTECQSMFSNKVLKIPTTTGGTLWEADFVEFTDSGVTMDFTTVDTATRAIAMGFR